MKMFVFERDFSESNVCFRRFFSLTSNETYFMSCSGAVLIVCNCYAKESQNVFASISVHHFYHPIKMIGLNF
jgi:hypothetical protein